MCVYYPHLAGVGKGIQTRQGKSWAKEARGDNELWPHDATNPSMDRVIGFTEEWDPYCAAT